MKMFSWMRNRGRGWLTLAGRQVKATVLLLLVACSHCVATTTAPGPVDIGIDANSAGRGEKDDGDKKLTRSELIAAIASHNTRKLEKVFAESDELLFTTDLAGRTLLHEAATTNSSASAQALLEVRMASMLSLLLHLSYSITTTPCCIAFQAGIDVDVPDRNGETAFFIAGSIGYTHVAR